MAIGSGIGGLGLIEQNHTSLINGGPRKLSPFFVPSTIINMVSGHLSIMKGLQGPNIAVTTACTTGTHAIGMAGRMIAYGDAGDGSRRYRKGFYPHGNGGVCGGQGTLLPATTSPRRRVARGTGSRRFRAG
ncbi:beta-ketoacyl synthase N-terminal-like domain-containing protein [Escherichia coli]